MIHGVVDWQRMTAQGATPAPLVAGAPAPYMSGDVWLGADLALTNGPELGAAADDEPALREAIVALYRREGHRFVGRLRGGFAIALWDGRTGTLLLAVDAVGIKRLYVAADARRCAFASRSTALRAVAGGAVDAEAVYLYLNFGFVPAPCSIYAGVRRLAPGHVERMRSGHADAEPYWDMRYPVTAIREDDAASTVVRLTERAVTTALGGAQAKETGAFLSGGTDSSTVVGLMARLTGERVNAFSIGFDEERYDELAWARLAAAHFGAAHYTANVSADDAFASLDELVAAYDEPFGNNSAIGTLAAARLARSCGVRRLLAGDGGDEIFGGNERYRIDGIFARYHRIPAVLRRALLEPALAVLPDGGETVLGRAQRYVRRANIPNPRRFFSYEFFFAQEASRLLAPDFRSAAGADAPWSVVHRHWDRTDADDELNRLLYLDMKLTIGDNDLLKVTRTADLAGVDVRFPFLDLPLVDFTGTLPAWQKVRGLEKRYLFKRAFGPLLPAATLGKQKHGFGVPTSLWLRTHRGFRELAHDALLSPRARQRGYFAPGAIEDLFARHATDTTPFYGDVLWTVLMLELWHRQAGR